MDKHSKIFIVGHNDIIDTSLAAYFKAEGFKSVISSAEIHLNPAIQPSVYDFFQQERPDYVVLASVRSGGIEANINSPAEFIYENLESQNNIVYAAQKFGVKKLLFFGASCLYPIDCPQPMPEEQIGTGALEKTSEPYAVAKLAGLRLCQAFRKQYGFNAIVTIPATIYGPGSNVDLKTAHVMGALIAKFVDAVWQNKDTVDVWGSGAPRREFLYVDDFVAGCHFLMEKYNDAEPVNLGFGEDISIKELAQTIARVTGFKGRITFDSSKPDGAMKKLLDSRRLRALGWKPKTDLEQGIKSTFEWYKNRSSR